MGGESCQWLIRRSETRWRVSWREEDEVMKRERAVARDMYLPLKQTVHGWEKQTAGAEMLHVLYVGILYSVMHISLCYYRNI